MKTIPLIQRNFKASMTSSLLALFSCCLLQGQVLACGTTSEPAHAGHSKVIKSHAQKDTSPIDLDYFQSSDNPMRG
jgi:hypothetical protein